MKHATLFLAAVLALAAFPNASVAQSRTADGWWDWAGQSDRTERSDRTTRTERGDRTTRRAEPRGTVRPNAERRRSTRTERREDARRAERREATRRAERRRDRDDDWDDDDRYDDDDWDDDRYEDRGRRTRKNGPPFCRNGAGHPTKGMQWCYDKGYANRRADRRYDDRRRDRRDDRWERRSIEDIIFGTPRDRDRRTRTVNRSVLDDILGRRAFTDLTSVASGPLTGRWIYPDATSRVLQLRDGRGPLAEMTDFDGDNRVDLFLVDRTR